MMRAAGAVLFALFASGCAQVREISGGPKDESGPSLVSASPVAGSLRFVGDRFVLRFDERVQVKRPASGLLVSPPMDPPPVIKLAGAREVEVSWTGPLRPGTTYNFAVGEAIQDLTEGNPAAGLSYIFSTGDALDSLTIAGLVSNAFTLAPQEGVLVSAYAPEDSLAFTQGRPAFATRTDKQGRFELRHLPDQVLRITALKDLNGNYRYDLPAEEIAFGSELISPRAPGDSLARPMSLLLFQEASAQQRVLSSSITEDRAWRIVLARPAERIAVRDLAREGGMLTWAPEWGALRDTVHLWPSDTTALSEGRFELSTEHGALDTLRYRPLRPMPFALTVRAVKSSTGSSQWIRASRPIAQFDQRFVRLIADSADLVFTLKPDSSDSRSMRVQVEGQLPSSSQLLLLPKALRDIYGGTNDTLRIALGAVPASASGILRVTVTAEQEMRGMLVLELLDARGAVVRKQADMSLGERVSWERLEPGNHSLRLTEDANGNGRWDAGNWQEQRQPERLRLHGEAIQVRAGWDFGIDWRLKVD
jgi:hypothetical protein